MSCDMSAGMSLVSIIAPCRNERGHVLAFCDAVAQQRLPPGVQMEVLVADGRSDDGTREALEARCRADPRFRLVDNPGRIVASGLNRCLEQAQGSIIVRLDMHTTYADDYVTECLAALARSGAANVGGPWRAVGDGGTQRGDSNSATQRGDSKGATQRAIAAAFQSRWIAGGARSRDLDYEGPVDTVYLGCWPRATFDRHGLFDETLVRNQDDEHNLRLARAGALVWQSARIRSSYRPRASLAALFRQQRQYGYWKPFVMRKHGRAASLRQLVPGLFVGACGALAALGLAWPLAWLALAELLLLYVLFVAACSLAIAREAGRELLPRLPAVIVAYHVGYGLGSVRGWFDVLTRARPSAAYGVLTR